MTGPIPRFPEERPFVDPAAVPALYADQSRVQQRSNALLTAKISGAHVGEATAALLAAVTHDSPTIADIGCGTGRPLRTLLLRFPAARFLAIDASPSMLAEAGAHIRERLPHLADHVTYLEADFHQFPIHEQVLHAAVAIFCLYHSPRPEKVISELARALRPGGSAVLVTKSADSYRELDQLLVDTGLDPGALDRPSLYESVHGGNLPELAANVLTVEQVQHDRHTFVFRDAAHLADYLSTVPKYRFIDAADLTPSALADRLRRARGDGPFVTTSVITYVLSRRG